MLSVDSKYLRQYQRDLEGAKKEACDELEEKFEYYTDHIRTLAGIILNRLETFQVGLQEAGFHVNEHLDVIDSAATQIIDVINSSATDAVKEDRFREFVEKLTTTEELKRHGESV